MDVRRSFVVCLGAFTLSCASSPPPEPSPAPPTPVEPASAAEAPPPAPEPAPVTDAAPAEPAEDNAPPPAAAEDENQGRQIRYVVNPDGMRVRVAGVVLVPKAELVTKGGLSTIKLVVEASSEDGKTHSILAPSGKELAFAGKVRRADGTEETFTDQREGDRDVSIGEGTDAKLSRTFPDKGKKPFKTGDEVELAVGLWGLGEDANSRRPVRALCKVTLSFPRKTPKLKVLPPDTAGK
jgi:hypothetical protein